MTAVTDMVGMRFGRLTVTKRAGTLHSFANTGGPARYLQLFSPGGMERYFAERAALLKDAAPGARDRTALSDLNRRYGMEFVEASPTS